LFRQIGDAQLIAHCLLIHARTKLRIDPDGSAMYISNANEKVEMYLEEAIQLFVESKWHDNVQGDLNTAMGKQHSFQDVIQSSVKSVPFYFFLPNRYVK
jgi:hypothetical protein